MVIEKILSIYTINKSICEIKIIYREIKKPSTMRASKKLNINKQGKMKKILTLI